MNILLTGASGFLGRHISAALIAAGHRVIPLSRRDGVDISAMTKAQRWRPYLKGVDAVINSVGIIGEEGAQRFTVLHSEAPAALFRACVEAGVTRVIQISALGADETAFSAFHRSKRAADDLLRTLDLEWFVLRPSLVFGLGGRSARLFMRLARLPRIPVLGDGRQTVQPVHVDDVVATVLRCLGSPESRLTLDLAGAELWSFAEWLQRLRLAQGLPRTGLIHLPYGCALALARLGQPFSPLLRAENLRMLQAGYRADAAPWIRFLGREPLSAQDPRFFAETTAAGRAP